MTVIFTIISYKDSLDWKNLTADEIFDRVTNKVKPGSIVLFHNAALHTPEALPRIIEKLQSDGYKIVPVSEIIMKDNFKIDSTGKQIATENQANPTASDIPSAQPDNSGAASDVQSDTKPASNIGVSKIKVN